MIEAWSPRSRMRRKKRRESDGWSLLKRPFIRESRKTTREKRNGDVGSIGSTQQRLIRVSLRALVQCVARLTIINKAIIILNPAESLRAEFRGPLSSYVASFPFVLLSLSFIRDLCIFVLSPFQKQACTYLGLSEFKLVAHRMQLTCVCARNE